MNSPQAESIASRVIDFMESHEYFQEPLAPKAKEALLEKIARTIDDEFPRDWCGNLLSTN